MDLTLLTIFAYLGAIIKAIIIMSEAKKYNDLSLLVNDITANCNGVNRWMEVSDFGDGSRLLISNGVEDFLANMQDDEGDKILRAILIFMIRAHEKCRQYYYISDIKDVFLFNAPYEIEIEFNKDSEIHMRLYDYKKKLIYFTIETDLDLGRKRGLVEMYMESFFPDHENKNVKLCFQRER